jgi:hypothetical protein
MIRSVVQRFAIAGVVATAVMTMVTMVAPYMGLPPMNPPAMLSAMLGVPIVLGWLMHVMIGVTFAVIYGLVFLDRLRTTNVLVKGAIFGVVVFMFAQAMMLMMRGLTGQSNEPSESMGLQIIGGVIGHVVYGVTVALVARTSGEVRS